MAETQELDLSRLLLPIHEDDHVQGSVDAPYTLVEYGDYQCPNCGHLFVAIRDLRAELGDELRIAFRHYPLSGIHRDAQMAAEAAEAAGAQDHFWEMHDLLFEHQNALRLKYLYQYAEQIDLDTKRFRSELKERRYEDLVREHFKRGVQNGVYSTPGLFINGIRYDGPLDIAILRSRIVSSGDGRVSPDQST